MHIDEPANLINTQITKSLSSEPVPTSTPSADWRAKGEADPFGTEYDCERAKLCLGSLTDDQLANAVYLHNHRELDLEAVLRGEPSSIVLLTAAKERIRWLSRALVKAQELLILEQEKSAAAVEIAAEILAQPDPVAPQEKVMNDTTGALTDAQRKLVTDIWMKHDPTSFNVQSTMLRFVEEVVTTLDIAAAAPTDEPEAPKPPIAIEALKEDIQTDPEYAWVWQSTLAMRIKDSLGCSNVQGNKAAASIMELVFDVDVRKLKEWNHDPEPQIDSRIPIDPENLKLVLRTISGLENTKIYSDRDRGYNKALDHVSEKIAELFTTVFDAQIAKIDLLISEEEQSTIGTLTELLYEVWNAFDNAEETRDGDHIINKVQYRLIDTHLDKLDALPSDPLHEQRAPGKARWALRRLLPTTGLTNLEDMPNTQPQSIKLKAENQVKGVPDFSSWQATEARIKQLMEDVGLPNSQSLAQAFKQLKMEVTLYHSESPWEQSDSEDPGIPPGATLPEFNETWLHEKSGAYYKVLGITSKPDPEKATKHPQSVYYEGPDGRRWVRTLSSWFQSFTPYAPALHIAGVLKKGDMRVIDGVTWHCTDPKIDRWVSQGSSDPECLCKVGDGVPHAETCPVTSHVRALFAASGESAQGSEHSAAVEPELSEDETKFLELIRANPGYKFNSGEAYDRDGNSVWGRLESLGLIRCVGSYKWAIASLTDEEVHAARMGRFPGNSAT